MSDTKPLNDKQDLFCREYIMDFNGAAAARRAGYSVKTADKQAWRLLQIPAVQAKLTELKAARIERTTITADSILRRIEDIAIRCQKDETWESAAALKANELLGKHLGLFNRVDLNFTEEKAQDAIKKAIQVVSLHVGADVFKLILADLEAVLGETGDA